MPLSTTAAPHPATASTASGPAWICVVVAPARSNASRSAGTTSAPVYGHLRHLELRGLLGQQLHMGAARRQSDRR